MIQSATLNRIDELESTARVWIFQSSVLLSGAIREDVEAQLSEFLAQWAAHGHKLFAAYEIRFDRFIIIAVDEQMAMATGCSIDKLMRTIQQLDHKYELQLLDRMKVAYRSGEDVKECSVSEFTAMLENGSASGDTMVFNNVVQNVGELRAEWEVRVSQSWHANLLP